MKEHIYLIGGICLAVLILAIVLAVYLRRRRIRKLGLEGEKKVAGILKRFAAPRSYRVLNDVYLPLYDKTTQIDHILVGFFGILVIETKNISGELYGDPKKKDWLHIVGSKRHTLYNPLMQNQAHIDCLRHLLAKDGLYRLNLESLIVFPKKKLEVYLPSGLPTVTGKQLPRFLRQDRFQKDNGLDVDAIVACIEKNRITDKAVIAGHVKNVKEMAKNH